MPLALLMTLTVTLAPPIAAICPGEHALATFGNRSAPSIADDAAGVETWCGTKDTRRTKVDRCSPTPTMPPVCWLVDAPQRRIKSAAGAGIEAAITATAEQRTQPPRRVLHQRRQHVRAQALHLDIDQRIDHRIAEALEVDLAVLDERLDRAFHRVGHARERVARRVGGVAGVVLVLGERVAPASVEGARSVVGLARRLGDEQLLVGEIGVDGAASVALRSVST